MHVTDIDWQPSPRKLRQFAVCAWLVVPALAWWWHASPILIVGLMTVMVAVVCLAWCLPAWVKPLYIGMSLAALPIGWLVGESLLLLVYFAVFLPIGVALRVAGRDSLQRRRKSQAVSYWEQAESTEDAKQYYRRY